MVWKMKGIPRSKQLEDFPDPVVLSKLVVAALVINFGRNNAHLRDALADLTHLQ
jgi:hypothetical protein